MPAGLMMRAWATRNSPWSWRLTEQLAGMGGVFPLGGVDPTLHGDSGSLGAAVIEKMTRSGYYFCDGRALVRWRSR